MREFDENRQKSACVTGHRTIEDYSLRKDTEKRLKALVERGYSTFYVGMAVGFDTLCFQILEKLREENDIKIIACIPCPSQPERFSFSQKKEYSFKPILFLFYTLTLVFRCGKSHKLILWKFEHYR